MTGKPLIRAANVLWHYADGIKTCGPNPLMAGDCTGLWGDCTGLWGDCSDLRGNCTDLRGNCTGLRGDCTGLWGDLDEIPQSARPCNIDDWVAA